MIPMVPMLLRQLEQASKAFSKHALMTQIGEGSLPKEIFERYVIYDAFFLKASAKGLNILSKRAPPCHKSFIEQLSSEMYHSELKHHKKYLCVTKPSSFFFKDQSQVQKLPSIDSYINHILTLSTKAPFIKAMAAYFPCYLLYNVWGLELKLQGCHQNNPYGSWIESAASPRFSAATRFMTDLLVEKLKDPIGLDTQEEIFATLSESIRHELSFLDEIYHKEVHDYTFRI